MLEKEPVSLPATSVKAASVKTEKELVLEKIQAILKEYNGLESDIPVNHEYWAQLNLLRAMK